MKDTKYYVYLHKRVDDHKIFYVGKGFNSRAISKHNRNKYWHNVVNKHGYYIEYAAKDLSEEEAFELEIFLIQECKLSDIKLVNMTDGGEGSSGFKHSEESLEKIRIKCIGRVYPPHSKETIEKRKNSFMNNKENLEICRQRIIKLNKENNPALLKAFKIKCIEDDKIFKSIREAARYYDLDNSYLSKHLKGEYESVKNKTFVKI